MVLRMKESDITRKVSEAGRNIEEKNYKHRSGKHILITYDHMCEVETQESSQIILTKMIVVYKGTKRLLRNKNIVEI